MGIWAAKSAVLVAAHLGLSDKAARCLTHMAITVLDKGNDGQAPRRYFGGRDRLAIAIGYVDDALGTPAAHAAVRRALAQLIDSGAVQLYREGHGGFRSEYYLRLKSDEPASSEVLPALASTPALGQGHARRTPVSDRANGLRTREQRRDTPQPRETPGVPQGVRRADPEGYAQRRSGVRPASDRDTPGVPPIRNEQEDHNQQNLSRTRAREELKELESRIRSGAA